MLELACASKRTRQVDAQSRPSIGSRLSTRTLTRFQRLASGSESKRSSLPPSRVTHPRRFPTNSTRCAILRDFALERLGQTPHQFLTVKEHSHLSVQSRTCSHASPHCLRSALSAHAARPLSALRARGRLDFVDFDAGLEQRFAVALVFGVDRNSVRGSQ